MKIIIGKTRIPHMLNAFRTKGHLLSPAPRNAPITTILIANNGSEKETIELDINQPHVWSSSTLYPAAVREDRAQWFHQYMNEKQQVLANDMYQFHRYTHNDNQENGLVINRNDEMQTLSITQAFLQQNKVSVLHYDLITKEDFTTSFITV